MEENSKDNKKIEIEKLEKGDILMLNRGLYKHFGIYIGENSVIHYTDKSGDWGKDICVQKTSLKEFAKDSEIVICKLPESFIRNNKVYSPDETVERAFSRLGEREYNLVTNNCEHFAIWCKTGISESKQVDNVLKTLSFFSLSFGVKKMIDAINTKKISDIGSGVIGIAGATAINYFGNKNKKRDK